MSAPRLRWGPVLLLLVLCGVWGVTNLYIKRFLPGRAVPIETLFYQLGFSAPLLFALSWAMEDRVWFGLSWEVSASLFYQCIVVAFLSYLVWFELIHRYPVSLLAAFTSFTPVFGVFLSGALILGEPLTPAVLVSLGLVSGGMVLVNRSHVGAARTAVPDAEAEPSLEPIPLSRIRHTPEE